MAATLGFGTAPFIPDYGLSGSRRGDERVCLIREAIEAGIRFVDTAATYADAEAVIGTAMPWLRERGVRVCTKLAASQLPDGLARSLEQLTCWMVDAVLVHSATVADLADERLARAMQRVKVDAAVLRTGASTYGINAAQRAIEQSWCEMLQVEHSIVNPSVVAAVRGLKRPGQELVVRSVLCQGLLTVRCQQAEWVSTAVRRRLDQLEEQAAAWNMTLPELAIRFALDTEGVDVVLVGMSSREELATALAAWRRPALSPAQRRALAAWDASTEDWAHPERWKVAATS